MAAADVPAFGQRDPKQIQGDNGGQKAEIDRGQWGEASSLPAGVKVRTVKNRVPSRVTHITGREGLLCSSGTLGVRSRCRISTWVHMDSRNHPVWKSAMKESSLPLPTREAKLPPHTAGHSTKNR